MVRQSTEKLGECGRKGREIIKDFMPVSDQPLSQGSHAPLPWEVHASFVFLKKKKHLFVYGCAGSLLLLVSFL